MGSDAEQLQSCALLHDVEGLCGDGSSIYIQALDKYERVYKSVRDAYLKHQFRFHRFRRPLETHLAFARAGKILGHFEQVNWPSGRCRATAGLLTEWSMVWGDCVKEQSWLDTVLSIEAKVIGFGDEVRIEMWFPLSSASKGLERSETGVLAGRKGYRTPPPSGTRWLASETDLVRSR